MNDEKIYYLYMLLCDHTIIYTGIAINPLQRLQQHQQGHPNGAKFTRRFKQLQIVYQVKVGTRSLAQSFEIKLKKLNRKKKQHVIDQQLSLEQLNLFL